jgi:hypothetical protein
MLARQVLYYLSHSASPYCLFSVLILIALVIKFINTHLDYGNSLQVIGPTHSYLGSEDYEGSRILPYLQTNKLAWMLSASWLLTEYMSPE